MGEYICRKCGATLDPGEKCRCEFHSNAIQKPKKSDSWNQEVRFEVRDGKAYAVMK